MQVEIEIPSNLSEISLDRYQKYMLTLNNSDDKEFVFQKMIEIFCGLELKEVVKMKASTVIELVQHFNKIFNEKTAFKHRFKLNGVEFGFIPSVNPPFAPVPLPNLYGDFGARELERLPLTPLSW